MRDYNYRKNWNDLLTPEIVKKLTLIHEYKGEQRLFIEAHKDELKELVEIAKVQSTEASNKIEGISTADDRLKNLVQAKTTPRNRDESEIAGYRDVLNTIHENYDYIPINANYILQLHRDLYKFLGNIDGGIFKTSDNIIREMDAEGNEKIRFRPVAAWETPASIDELYSSEENYNALTYEDTLIVKEEVAPLILSDGDEASAVRFDALMYGIELAYLAGKKYSRARSDLHKKIAGIASVANIPEIQAQTDLINKVLNTDYVDTAGINEFEEIREKLRNLMKYLPNSSIRYDTNFTDEVLSTEWNESELENDDLKNYKAKAEYYIRQHQDNIAIAKLKRNKPLTSTDIAMLEEVLWSEVGTKQDYEQEFGEKPLGEFVREIVGLDMNAAKEAFSEYLTNASLDSRQIYFVNQIVEYIVHNGMMKDLSVLQESPFTDRGSVVEIFTDLSVWMGIRKVIDMINANAVA